MNASPKTLKQWRPVVCLSLSLLVSLQHTKADLSEGLVAYYPLNGDWNDYSGHTNHLTNYGATFAQGVVGQAAAFDGTSAYLAAEDSPDFHFGTNELSIALWIKPLSELGVRTFIGKEQTAGDAPSFQFRLNEGLPEFLVVKNGHEFTSVTSAASLADGRFHHLAGVRSSTGYRLYIDGVRVAILMEPPLVGDNLVRLLIGAQYETAPGSPSDPFHGFVDDVRFYNRALSDEEVAQLALRPLLRIAVSQVRLCWDSVSNASYQVQYRSEWTTNTWQDLGSSIPGDGHTQCVTDDVAGPTRFYRLWVTP